MKKSKIKIHDLLLIVFKIKIVHTIPMEVTFKLH